MIEINNNQTVQECLSRLVVEEIMGYSFDKANIKIGHLEANYFSFIFSIEIFNDKSSQKVFVKIPKEDLRHGKKGILPISAADRCLALAEARSLLTLSTQWCFTDIGVSWVCLRGEVPDYNAIVTDAAEGSDAITVFRCLDICRRLGNLKGRDKLRTAMARLGTALGRFHLQNADKDVFSLDLVMPKIFKYIDYLKACTGSTWLGRASKLVERFGMAPINGMLTTTLKGIDIRNVLLDGKGRITMLDPGKMKRGFREEDLARFLITWRILYWGSGWFFLGLRPDPSSEVVFLKSYYKVTGPPTYNLLDIFMCKEIIKNWYIAYIALSLKNWPQYVNRLVARYYIDRFFENHLVLQEKKL